MTDLKEKLARALAAKSAEIYSARLTLKGELDWRPWLPFVDAMAAEAEKAGYRLLPVEATEEMIRAADLSDDCEFGKAYERAVSAAPGEGE